MITKKMIEQACKDRERSLLVSSAIIGTSGFVLMIIALWSVPDGEVPSIANNILFIFGLILGCFGIFTAPGEK